MVKTKLKQLICECCDCTIDLYTGTKILNKYNLCDSCLGDFVEIGVTEEQFKSFISKQKNKKIN